MNVIAICGSPRQGNTEFVLKRLLEKAEVAGHTTELVLLREKKVEHCLGCMACGSGGVCVVDDDMNPIIERMKTADMIIFGSPNYFNNVSGIMKDFFDRLHSLYHSKTLSGKKALVVFVGDGVKTIDKAIVSVRSITNSMEMEIVGDLYLTAGSPQGVENDSSSVQKIDDFARNFLS